MNKNKVVEFPKQERQDFEETRVLIQLVDMLRAWSTFLGNQYRSCTHLKLSTITPLCWDSEELARIYLEQLEGSGFLSQLRIDKDNVVIYTIATPEQFKAH